MTNNPDDAIVDSGRGPGARLRQARQAQGLSQEDVARRLKFVPWLVEAIETDDYSQMSAPIYARGYIRNYSELLGLPADEIVAGYERHHSSTPPPLRATKSLTQGEVTSSHKGMKIASAVVALVFIGLAVMWFVDMQRNRNTLDDVPLATGPVAPGTDAAAIPERFNPELSPEASPERTNDTNQTASGSTAQDVVTNQAADGTANPGADPAAALGTAVAPGVQPGPDSAAPVAASASGNGQTSVDTAGVGSADSQASVATPAAAVAEDGTVEVNFEFADQSWVQIVQLKPRKTKLKGLLSAGDSRSFKAKLPLRFLVGNANTVTVNVGGQPYELTPHIKGNLAKFTLTADQL